MTLGGVQIDTRGPIEVNYDIHKASKPAS
jgi:hypothetical protein